MDFKVKFIYARYIFSIPCLSVVNPELLNPCMKRDEVSFSINLAALQVSGVAKPGMVTIPRHCQTIILYPEIDEIPFYPDPFYQTSNKIMLKNII